MPTKAELLEAKTKDDLVKLASKAGVTKVKKSMKKGEMVKALAKSRKLTKADL
ncbi:MAG: hypothetical protein ACOC8A_01580 [bacterium]